MLTEKENLLMTLRGEVPEWVPRNMYPSPGHPPASAGCGPSFLNARRTPQGGFDIWGVEFVTTNGLTSPLTGFWRTVVNTWNVIVGLVYGLFAQ